MTVGYTPIAGATLPFFIAVEDKIFQKYGFEIAPVFMGGSPLINAALLAGEFPIGYTGGKLASEQGYDDRQINMVTMVSMAGGITSMNYYMFFGGTNFADFAGHWSGAGTLRPENGAAERIRCNATYRPGGTQREIDLQLRCASDSYNFDLVGQFTADDQNQVSGRWTERSRSTGGTAVGNAQGDRLQLHIESAGFAAEVVMVTRSRRQSVDIDSHGAGQVVRATITLNRS